jgi:flavin reductase (DIM6/NTAB) family NADH-FMN oxidoreductase RutF
MLSDDDRRAAASALDMAATTDQQTFRHVIGHVASGVTQDAIHRSRAFGLNILDEDQGVLAERFATPMATSSPAST